eukprot:TRINITY_DN47626_c0_g1_i1.p1 TRINITY_DN47626_c0_g1~~TRINITY_DN47626_c0_g1_i1.p1  ORF type:complete len:618 (+),score=60.85 TRINITY_DN47626_c0_g1_i1:98-1855(+)
MGARGSSEAGGGAQPLPWAIQLPGPAPTGAAAAYGSPADLPPPPALPPECAPCVDWEPGRSVQVRRLMPDLSSVGEYCRRRSVPREYCWQDTQAAFVGASGTLLRREGGYAQLEFPGGPRSWWPLQALLESAVSAPPALPPLPKRDDSARETAREAAAAANRQQEADMARRQSLAPGGASGGRRQSIAAGVLGVGGGGGRRLSIAATRRASAVSLSTVPDAESAGGESATRRGSAKLFADTEVEVITTFRVGDWVQVISRPGQPCGLLVNDPGRYRWTAEQRRKELSIHGAVQCSNKGPPVECWIQWCFHDGRKERISAGGSPGNGAEELRLASRLTFVRAWWDRVLNPWLDDQRALWKQQEVGSLEGQSEFATGSGYCSGPTDDPQDGEADGDAPARRVSVASRRLSRVQRRLSRASQPRRRSTAHSASPRHREPSPRHSPRHSPRGAIRPGPNVFADGEDQDGFDDGPGAPPPPPLQSKREKGAIMQWTKAYDEWWQLAHLRYWRCHLRQCLAAEADALQSLGVDTCGAQGSDRLAALERVGPAGGSTEPVPQADDSGEDRDPHNQCGVRLTARPADPCTATT